MFVVARSPLPMQQMIAAIRRQVWSLDRRLPLTEVTSTAELVRASAANPRFRTLVLSTFAVIAAVLALVGLYGVVSQRVSDRRHEIGIRIALGAEDSRIFGMVLGDGLRLTLIGIGLGTLAALALTRYLSSMLFAVSSTDPLTFVGAATALLTAALLACLTPARRATRADPRASLRRP
jgi:ABC-type antimicrobial peptide transport system permease subunit